MSMASIASTKNAPQADARARAMLWLFASMAIVGATLLGWKFPALRDGATVVDIEFARTAIEFSQRLAEDWILPPGQAPGWCEALAARPGLPNAGRLSCHLLFDSLLLVPGYAGLLVFFTLGLAARAGLRGALPHALCMPALSAALFDLAENGMTVRAADHLMFLVLADAAVQDVHDAALVKWWMLVIAAGVVGVTAFAVARTAQFARSLLTVGGALMLMAAVAWGAGLLLIKPPSPMVGVVLFASALLVLTLWRLRQPRDSLLSRLEA